MAQLKDLLVAGPARILGPLYTSGGITGNLTGNASTATTANKVTNALTIQTNGTTAATFDGSAAKTVNITPANIGAAASSHTHSSYVNQNAFSNVVVGSTTVAADSATDTLTLVAGSNVTITPDATNDKITIAATNTWRGVQDNLTSTATDQSLSANQGKVLKGLVDGKAAASHTHVKSEVGLGNVDNTADADKNVKSATKLQTYKQGSTTSTYGDQYPLYAQWETNSILKLVCSGYTVKTDYATNAGNADTVDSKHASDFAAASHTHTKSQITDFPTIPTKTSQLTNDSGFKTTDNNTTYSLSKSGTTITLTGSDGSKTSVTDTDTNTWRGIQNNLTSDSTTDSLSAAQGKALKALIDGKADSSHTHSYLPLSGGTLTGQLTAPNFISSGAAYGLRVIGGSYGFLVRNDGSDTWFMLTNENDTLGGYNSLRPFRINNSTGLVYMSNGLRSSEGRTSGPHTTYSSYMWRNTSAGTSATPVADSTYGSSGAVYLQYS